MEKSHKYLYVQEDTKAVQPELLSDFSSGKYYLINYIHMAKLEHGRHDMLS
jgi:hypothetical protein